MQVFNVCTSPVVQHAWDAGQPLAVHGLVYDLRDGLLKSLVCELLGTLGLPASLMACLPACLLACLLAPVAACDSLCAAALCVCTAMPGIMLTGALHCMSFACAAAAVQRPTT